MPDCFRLGRICLAAASLLSAQTPPAAEVTTQTTTPSFQTGTNLVPVTVVVRDRTGHAIGTLGREDFSISDSGKPRMISRYTLENLQEMPAGTGAKKAGAGGSPGASGNAPLPDDGIPDHYVAYLFDDIHMSPEEVVRTRQATARQIDSTASPARRMAIFTVSNAVMQEFSGDLAKLHKALDSIGTQHNVMSQGAPGACPPMSYLEGDKIYNKDDARALDLAASDSVTCANLFGPGGSVQWDTAVRMATSAARDAVIQGDKNGELTINALRDVFARMGSVPGQRLVVLISPGTFLTDILRLEETGLIERALKAKVVVGSLDARGLYSATEGSDAIHANVAIRSYRPGGGGAPIGQYRTQFAQEEALAQSELMGRLALGTGGAFFQGTNDYDGGIRLTATAPEYLYVLGFSPSDLKFDGRYHNLKVSLKPGLSGLTVQARQGYFAPAHGTTPAQLSKQQIEEEFFSRDEIRDLPAVLQTQYFTDANGDVRLSATAEIDVKKLAFHKESDRSRNDITVVTGVFDNDGNYVAGEQKVVEMRLRDETLATRLNSGISVKSVFAGHSGRYVVRMVVRDSEGQTMAAQSRVVDIP